LNRAAVWSAALEGGIDVIQQAISKLVQGTDLTEDESMRAMNCIMEGRATQVQIAGFLTALRMKGETIAEITGCARCMREKAERISPAVAYCIDTCGTGGDGADTFNISTASALVAAAGGVHVAKHGNRAVSSRCGSADVLEALGINIQLEPCQVEKCIGTVGIGFLFARNHHKCMRYAATPRSELGIRTIFNILGPLTNPAGAQGQVLGVFDESLTEILAGVLHNLGTEIAMVVHGMDGLDEITTTDATKITEVQKGQISTHYITPEAYGLKRAKKPTWRAGTQRPMPQSSPPSSQGKKARSGISCCSMLPRRYTWAGRPKICMKASTWLPESSIRAGQRKNWLSSVNTPAAWEVQTSRHDTG
jgi:anthranilate phosphoribosyltransferase